MEVIERGIGIHSTLEPSELDILKTKLDSSGTLEPERSVLTRKIVDGSESNKTKLTTLRGALGDKKNIDFSGESVKHGKVVTEKLQLKQIPRSFEVYCDGTFPNKLERDTNETDSEKESADEQFERVDPDAGIEGFSLGKDREVFDWKYDFGIDELVHSACLKLGGTSEITSETHDSNGDDTILVDDW